MKRTLLVTILFLLSTVPTSAAPSMGTMVATGTIKPRATTLYSHIRLRQNEISTFSVSGKGDGTKDNVDCLLFDEKSKQVAAEEGNDGCTIRYTPNKEQDHTLLIVNLGKIDFSFSLAVQ
jgi:hypothetical protein